MEIGAEQEISWRLQCLKGHLAALIRMVEAEEPTPALLLQISALQGGLDKLLQILIRSHLKKCLELALVAERQREYEQALNAIEGIYQSGSLTRASLIDFEEDKVT